MAADRKTAQSEREERLKKALRANLRRRKAADEADRPSEARDLPSDSAPSGASGERKT
jgi:hypothetical protein